MPAPPWLTSTTTANAGLSYQVKDGFEETEFFTVRGLFLKHESLMLATACGPMIVRVNRQGQGQMAKAKGQGPRPRTKAQGQGPVGLVLRVTPNVKL